MLQFKPTRLQFARLLVMMSAVAAYGRLGTSQQPPSQDPGDASFKITSRLTLVDVTVTDSKSTPVQGLKESDFTVKEDGKSQAIKSFEVYGAERPSAQAAPPMLPPNVYTNAQPAAPTTSAVNVLMLDDVTTGLAGNLEMDPGSVMYARLQVIKYLKTMPVGAQFVILEMSSRLRVVQPPILQAEFSCFFPPVEGFLLARQVSCRAAPRHSSCVAITVQQPSDTANGAWCYCRPCLRADVMEWDGRRFAGILCPSMLWTEGEAELGTTPITEGVN